VSYKPEDSIIKGIRDGIIFISISVISIISLSTVVTIIGL